MAQNIGDKLRNQSVNLRSSQKLSDLVNARRKSKTLNQTYGAPLAAGFFGNANEVAMQQRGHGYGSMQNWETIGGGEGETGWSGMHNAPGTGGTVGVCNDPSASNFTQPGDCIYADTPEDLTYEDNFPGWSEISCPPGYIASYSGNAVDPPMCVPDPDSFDDWDYDGTEDPGWCADGTIFNPNTGQCVPG